MPNNNIYVRKHIIVGFCTMIILAFSSMIFAQGGGPGGGNNGGNNNGNNNGNNGGQNLQPLGNAPTPNENPITEPKRVLGKILFWDEQLSSDNTVACGTCHKPAAGGADSRLAINPGFDQIFGSADDIVGSPGIRALDENGLQLNDPIFGHDPQVTNRATPSFFTSMFADSNFWDGRATDEFVDPLNPNNTIIEEGGALESQAIGPILSTVEMAQQGRNWSDVVNKLEQVTPLLLAENIPADMVDALQGGSNYPQLFSAAFGDSEITPVRIAMAIATYERTLVPNETPWDLYIAGDNNAMTSDQIEGWELFDDTPCANCHRPPLFSDNNFRNIGLRPANEDLGQFEVTGQNNDRGDFKTPSLRNVGLRSALMHVGWVSDVSDAMDFYNAGTNNTGHVQFTQDQSGIPDTGVDIDELDVFGDDPVRRGQIIEFLVNGLTDPRAASETFPFDRPTLASETDTSSFSTNTNIAGLSSTGAATAARFSGSIVSIDGSNNSSTFSPSEVLAVTARIEVDPANVGESGNIYCVIVYQGVYYAMNASGGYQAWDGNTASLPATATTTLGSIENISIAEQLTQTSGEFEIYIGYDTNDGVLRYNSVPILFNVN